MLRATLSCWALRTFYAGKGKLVLPDAPSKRLLQERLLVGVQPFHILERGGAPVTGGAELPVARKGKPGKIHVETLLRQGRKMTIVVNVEAFQIDPDGRIGAPRRHRSVADRLWRHHPEPAKAAGVARPVE